MAFNHTAQCAVKRAGITDGIMAGFILPSGNQNDSRASEGAGKGIPPTLCHQFVIQRAHRLPFSYVKWLHRAGLEPDAICLFAR
jgi:hypothetical protein